MNAFFPLEPIVYPFHCDMEGKLCLRHDVVDFFYWYGAFQYISFKVDVDFFF